MASADEYVQCLEQAESLLAKLAEDVFLWEDNPSDLDVRKYMGALDDIVGRYLFT